MFEIIVEAYTENCLHATTVHKNIIKQFYG